MSSWLTASLLSILLTCPLAASDRTDGSAPATPAPPASSAAMDAIQDNSFLVEEAYNQEAGVIQHISYLQRSLVTGDWVFSQTDEWPVRSLKHQLSLTLSALHSGEGSGWGDTALNYRYQLAGNGQTRLAVAPRISLLVPTGESRRGRGRGGLGIQTNLPVSVRHNRSLVTHWNVGMSWIPQAKNTLGEEARALDVNVGHSLVWLTSSRFNMMLETLWTSTTEVLRANTTNRRQDLFLSPGIRWAHNFRNGLQIVPGVGVPMGVGPSTGQKGLIFYLSFEHPWRIAGSR